MKITWKNRPPPLSDPAEKKTNNNERIEMTRCSLQRRGAFSCFILCVDVICAPVVSMPMQDVSGLSPSLSPRHAAVFGTATRAAPSHRSLKFNF